jgi:hypothetical protein
VLELCTRDAIHLQSAGRRVDTFPAGPVALFVCRVHRVERLPAVGGRDGRRHHDAGHERSVSVIVIGNAQIYAALLALGINLAVGSALMPLLDRLGMPQTGPAPRGLPPVPFRRRSGCERGHRDARHQRQGAAAGAARRRRD